ncbi:MAG: hypothetical protein ABIJ16_14260 [Bacteroidota bacterium]
MMKTIIIIILIFTPFILVAQQQYTEYADNESGKIYRLESPGGSQYEGLFCCKLSVYRKNGESLSLTSQFDLDESDGSGYNFADTLTGFRKLLLVKGRYKFYIFNLASGRIIGPIAPAFRGIGGDSQSGMLSGLKFMLDGSYIGGYCVDSGTFLFRLCDVYKPEEIIPADFPFGGPDHFFISGKCDKPESCTGILLMEEGWAVKDSLIFTGRKVGYPSYEKYLGMDDTGIEEILTGDLSVYSRYVIMDELDVKDLSYMVFDMRTRKMLDLPLNIRSSKELEEYLSKLIQ